MIRRLAHRERGSVLVLVAAAMFPIVAMMTFAIDVSHWFDYSRNLQNRADAAALAGGQMLGSCIGTTGTAGTTTNGLQSAAGKFAQLYSGASVGESAANLPYTDQAVAAATNASAGTGNGPGTGWPVATSGYANNMTSPLPNGTFSPLTLRAGLANINNFWVALNARDYSPSGGANTSFTMNSGGAGATFCNSDPTFDATDAQCFGQAPSGACAPGPMVDVKLTQKSTPLFVPIFSGLNPTIHAHARVTLQGEASSPDVRPIAVSDPGSFGCVTVFFKNDQTNSLLATAVLTETDPANFVWSNATPVAGVANTGPASVAMPTAANVYMQAYMSDCSGNGDVFDDSTNSGIELINTYGTTAPAAGEAPRITAGGVTLSGTCPTPTDQYFSSGGCNVQPAAHVTFSPDVTNAKNQATVTAVDTSGANAPLALSPDNSGTVWTPNGNQSLSIGDMSGRHPIEIKWSQTAGSVGGTACGTGNGGQPAPCTGTLGVQTQAFGACNGCDQPDDSGPIVKSQIALTTDPAGTTGENAFPQSSTQQLVVTLQLAGIRAETNAAAKPTILRFSGSTNHQTGLIDCGQGNGGSSDAYVVYGGCGPSNPFECATGCTLPLLNPLYVYSRGTPTDCSPAADQNYTDWPSGNHQDCVETTPGTRRVNIICALLQRITGVTTANFSASGSACNSNFGGTCKTNYWPNYNTDPNDPRKLTFILTSPLDLAAAAGAPQYWVPIRRFATFYITGWDTSLFPNCGNSGPPGNDKYPGINKASSDNGAIWGHWINDVEPGIGDENPCPVNSIEPVNCVPVLTR